MARSSLNAVAFQVLNQVMRKDYRETVVRRALDHLGQTRSAAGQALENAIHTYVTVRGFRKPIQAPKPLLAKEVVASSYSSEALLSAILQVWVESYAELQAIVENFLVVQEMPVMEAPAFDDGFTSAWTLAEMRETAEAFRAEHLDFDEDDVALMLCCLTGRAPLPDELIEDLELEEAGREIDQPNGDEMSRLREDALKWEQWLEELQELPADAPEWNYTKEFIQSVQQLAEEKLKELQATRGKLRQALATLTEQAADQFDYFSLASITDWTDEACPLARAADMAEEVEQLQELLIKHRELRQQPTSTLEEGRQQRKQLDELEEKIPQAYARLASALTMALTPDEPLPLPEAPTAEEEAESRGAVVTPGPTTCAVSSGEEGAASETPQLESATEELEPTMQAPPTYERMAEPTDICAESEITPTLAEEVAKPEPEQTAGAVEATQALEEVSSEKSRQPREEETVLVEEKATEPTCELVEPEPSSVPLPRLHCVREAATLIKTDDRDENWSGLVWALVAEDDLPAAYWLVQSLAASKNTILVPEWLLAAAQGSRWVLPESEMFVGDLLEIAQTHQPTSDEVQELIGLAAALRPALIAPISGLLGWLNVPGCCPALHNLVSAVHAFATLGIALRPADLLGVAGEEQRAAAIAETAQAARRWLDEATGRRTGFKRASDVWRRLVIKELNAILLPVSDDRRAGVKHVREQIDQWRDHDYVSNRIDEIDGELVGTNARPIVGHPRQQIIRRVEEACGLASRWCGLVEHQREIETRGTWLFEQVATLRTRVQETLPEAESALSELSSETRAVPLASASYCLRRALKQLGETLDLPRETGETATLVMNKWEWLAVDAEGLRTALARRLLWLPEISLADSGQPIGDASSAVALALRDACAEERPLRAAFEEWLRKQDYRFVELMLNALQVEDDAPELSRRYHEMIDGSRAALRDNVDETANAIEQALVDGIISDERSEYSAIVESIDLAGTLNFPERYRELQKVRVSLSAARQKRLVELRENWTNLQGQLAGSYIEAAQQAQVGKFIQAALDRGDTRVVEEGLARLTAAIDEGSDLEETLFKPAEVRDVLLEFREAEPRIEEWLETSQSLQWVADDIEQGRTRANIPFGEISPKRRAEAAKAVLAWRRLKQRGPGQRGNLDHIAALLQYLGFSLELGMGDPIRVEGRGTDWLYMRASMSTGDLTRPIPQFGSQAHGSYHVICLWERQGAATIAARLKDLGLNVHNVLVFFLGRLTARQRRDVTRISREQQLALAVLDETCMVFLAHEHDARLPVFLRCALPFAALNPYTPFQAGDVPPEMFFGREVMAQELQRPAGSCLVYGGRQLGKSALLRHVERGFNFPEREQYAWVENMKLVFDPQAGKGSANIWRALREGFKRTNLLSPRISTDRPEEIARYIREVMLESSERKVLVMFDEADDFLDAEASSGFREVIALRELMLETERRFKVIFAGLHNVQRFQGIPNQPLAHFGAPLCIGPLEPSAAQQLVRQPLEALGYRFQDNAAVLRILSYTNYHPGLIQLFCQELLSDLNKRGGDVSPPYYIEQRDVEGIYRKREVRERIRERFDWTLALDTRYQAIAWTLIVDQLEMRDSYARAYPPGDILRVVRDWWSQGFDEVGFDQLRGLLDEMCGLGVLVRNPDGHYRLRSPNLVRLMGTEADIENRLLELSEKQSIQLPDADSNHAPLDEAAQRYSPLTYSQERSLNQPQFGVGLVFATVAGGESLLPEAFKRFIPLDLLGDTGACTEIPPSINNNEKLRDWLDTHLQIHSRHSRLVVYQRPQVSEPEKLAGLVQEAVNLCNRHQSRERWMRVLFLLDAQATWVWLTMPQQLRKNLEDRADAVTFLRRWNLVGIRQRLAQHDKMHSDEVCQHVLKATGGWCYLLDNLLDRCGKQDDPRPIAQAMADELGDPYSQLRQEFQDNLGLEGNDAVRRVLKFICQESDNEVFVDFLTPEWIGGETPLTPEECDCAIEYLQRTSCVDLRADTVSVDGILGRILAQP